MPYCSQCGNQVAEADTFCARCGARQPGATPAASAPDALANLTPRTASILCYIPWVGWIAAIVILAAEKFRHNRSVRFHAFQGLYLFVAWLMNAWVLRPMLSLVPHFRLHQIIDLVLLGELAQRSAAED